MWKEAQREWQLLRREDASLIICELSRCGVDVANLKETRQLGIHGKKSPADFGKVFWIHRESRIQLCCHFFNPSRLLTW